MPPLTPLPSGQPLSVGFVSSDLPPAPTMDSSDSEAEDLCTAWTDPEVDRLAFPIGELLSTALLRNSCIGDDVSRKGTRVTRIASIQANDAGGSPSALA